MESRVTMDSGAAMHVMNEGMFTRIKIGRKKIIKEVCGSEW